MNLKPPSIFNDSLFSAVKVNKVQTSNVSGHYSTWINSVRVATTEQIDFKSKTYVIDGVTIVRGDRILIKNQANVNNFGGFANNGIYVFENNLLRVPEFNNGTSPVGAVFYVVEGTVNGQKFFNCTNNYSDIIGISFITFSEILGIPGGPNNSIQYNFPLGSFNGSSSLLYDNVSNTLTLGSDGYVSTLTSKLTGINQFYNINSYKDIIIKTGQRGNSQDSTLITKDGNLTLNNNKLIVLSDTSSYYQPGHITIQTGAATGTRGSLNFIAGTNGYVKIKSGAPNVDTGLGTGGISVNSSDVTLTNNNSINTTVVNDQLTFTKNSVTISTISSSATINSKQGFIVITNPTLVTYTYSDIVVTNSLINNCIIFVNVDKYAGTGNPVVDVISTTSTNFTIRVYDDSGTGLSNSPLTVGFISF